MFLADFIDFFFLNNQAVGCENQTVHIISLDPDNTLATLSLQVRSCLPSFTQHVYG